MKWVKWVQFGIGFWMFVSPWLLGFSEIIPALWSCMISGLVVAVMALWELFGGEATPQPLAQSAQYTTEV